MLLFNILYWFSYLFYVSNTRPSYPPELPPEPLPPTHPRQSLPDFHDETHPRTHSPTGLPVPRTCVGDDDRRFGQIKWYLLQEVHRCSFHWKDHGENTGVI